MNERLHDRRRIAWLAGGLAAGVLVGKGEVKKASSARAETPIPPQVQKTRAYLLEVANAEIGPNSNGTHTTVIPGITREDDIPIPVPPVPVTPEYQKQTRYIARRPSWTLEQRAKFSEPIRSIKTSIPVIGIGIDDGFAQKSLRTILNIAKAKGVTYTDFMKGQQRDIHAEFVKEEAESEMVEYGTHTQVHRDERNSDRPGVPPTRELLTADIITPETLLNKFNQTLFPWHRPPGGAASDWTMDVANSLGLITVNWSATADGGNTTNVNILKPGDIILLHFRDETAAQFSGWIDAVRARGLEPTALSNLFAVADSYITTSGKVVNI